jgi:hypothetical protein
LLPPPAATVTAPASGEIHLAGIVDTVKGVAKEKYDVYKKVPGMAKTAVVTTGRTIGRSAKKAAGAVAGAAKSVGKALSKLNPF